MENTNLRHVAIIQDEDEVVVLRKLNEAVDEFELKIINYNKDIVRLDGDPDPKWRIEIFFEGPNVFSYDFKGSQRALLNKSDASHSHSR